MDDYFELPNLDDFEDLEFVCNKGEFELHKICHRKTTAIYFAMIFALNMEQIGTSQIINLYREINISPKLNHPSVLKIIGYSPVDFSKDTRPVIILEYCKYDTITPNLIKDDTKKLMIIYGIASCISYLHSHNIIHRDLKPSNVFLDDRLFPKVTGFHLCKQINPESPEKSEFIKGTPAYLAPEVYTNHEYSKASDVYSFSMLVYEILKGVKIFKGYNKTPFYLRDFVVNGGRPNDFTMISKSYENLIKKCWSQNPEERPTFDQIIDLLKNDRSFINDNINEEEFREYIRYVEESKISYDSEKCIHQLDQLFEREIDSFCNVFNFRVQTIYDSEFDSIEIYMLYVNLKYFQKGELIGHNRYSNIYHLFYYDSSKSSYVSFSGKIFLTNKQKVVDLFEQEVFNHYQLYHRCISAFVGYSPVDFDHQKRFVIVSEFFPNSTLDKHLNFEYYRKLDDATKLIILYGIASGMSYLHSNSIIHRNLNPKNVFLDCFMFPKIGNFSTSKDIDDDENEFNSSSYVFNANLSYTAPEIITSTKYSKKSDVYSFAMIMYEVFTNESPFFGMNQYEIAKSVTEEGKRPEIHSNYKIPEFYSSLISRCWSQNPSERPTFDEILSMMKTDKNFISNEKCQKFIRYIEGENIVFEPIVNENILKDFQKINQINKDELNSLFHRANSIDLNGFEIENQKPLGEGSFGQVFKIIDKKNRQVYAAKILNQPIETIENYEAVNIKREIENSMELNHPSIVKFVGVSQTDFEKKSRLTIVSEFVSGGTLHQLISDTKNKPFNYEKLNETNKLKIIYGIASGMSYSHSHNIIHRDLKPSNIFLDDSLHPKIGDFGLSKKISENDKIEKSYSRLKGTFSYLAPEVITQRRYSKASDVYAFALIVFQIMTNERPFENLNRYQIMLKIPSGFRPEIKSEVPDCYQKLIRQCWSNEPENRMSFSEIVNFLKTDENFLTQKVDKNDFFKYINEI